MINKLFFVTCLCAFILCGCKVDPKCSTLCTKIENWKRACSVNPKLLLPQYRTHNKCNTSYLIFDNDEREAAGNTCYTVLVKWVIATGSEKLDCSVPPPIFQELEVRTLDPQKGEFD